MENIVNSRRKVGSRRYRYPVDTGLDPKPASAPKDRLHEVILEVICDGQGDPDHGEQVLLCAARDLSGHREGIYLYPPRYDLTGHREGTYIHSPPQARESTWQGRDGEDGFVYTINSLSKKDPVCPKCRTNPRITYKNLDTWLDALLTYSGGKPIKRRVDFRELPG
jgi:hypothetical protein